MNEPYTTEITGVMPGYPDNLDTIFEEIDTALLIYDKSGIVTKTNQVSTAFLGFNPVGMSDYEIAQKGVVRLLNGQTMEEDFLVKRVLNGETIKNSGYLFSFPAGEKKECMCVIAPLKINGNISGAICTWHDHNRNKQEQRLTDMGMFSAVTIHALRNPLGVIRAAAYNIKQMNKDKHLDKHISTIEKKVTETEQIINNLLCYSIVKKSFPEKVELYNFLNECVKNIANQYIDSGIQLYCDYVIFREVFLEIDPFQIREVLANIINNAFQAFCCKNGIITISGTIEEPDWILIKIADNGEGIDQGNLQKVFNSFFTRKSGGTGLGLTISKELIQLHNGEISIESEKGTGTRVYIKLPFKRIQHE